MILPKQIRKNATRRTAFTLLEVLVVVAILVILAGTAVIYIPQYLEDAKISKAQLECKAWDGAINKYYLNSGGTTYPTSLQEVANLIEDGQSKLNDPWNHQYQIDTSGQEPHTYTTCSTGRINYRGVNK